MSRLLALSALVTVCAASAPAQSRPATASSAPPIFREISIGTQGRIALGAPFAQRATLGAPVAEHLFLLAPRPGWSFGGTDSLLVRLGPNGHVAALRFVYRLSTNYAVLLAEYQEALGQPVRRVDTDSAGARVERARWQDARTRFELWRVTIPGQPPRTRSELIDLPQPR